MQGEKKVAVIYFWSDLKYNNFLIESSLEICVKNHKMIISFDS